MRVLAAPANFPDVPMCQGRHGRVTFLPWGGMRAVTEMTETGTGAPGGPGGPGGPAGTAPGHGVPGLDLAAFAAHFTAAYPGTVRGPLRASVLAGGKSNITYEVTDGHGRWVVRRPPLGHVLATALAMFGTDDQRKTWLQPLLDGQIRSAFAMTEPDVASSDATNISTRIERDGDSYVINGRKWWITGAMNPDARIFIVMGKTGPGGQRDRQQSMILVPRETPGLTVTRGMQVFGYDDHEHGGHAELQFTDVRVPAANLIGAEGDGFAIAQGAARPRPDPPLHALDRRG